MAGFYALAAIPARYALERGAWQDAAALEVPSGGLPHTIAIAHFARALGAARSGRAAAAGADVAALAALRDRLKGRTTTGPSRSTSNGARPARGSRSPKDGAPKVSPR